MCECGCGNPAPIATRTNKRKNYIKGFPVRFISGHNNPSGYKLTFEQRKAISLRMIGNQNGKGIVFTEERRRKLSESQKGKKHSKETIIKMSGSNNHQWKGGKYNYQGWIMVYSPEHPYNNGGYMLEHRLVMENHLKTHINPKLDVHHINGIKDDNRIENLKLVTKSQHAKIHKFWEKRNGQDNPTISKSKRTDPAKFNSQKNF